MTMLEFLQSLGVEALLWFWLPLLAWTAIALPGWWLLCRWRSASPLTHYWARLALLFGLPLGIIGAWLAPMMPVPASSSAATPSVIGGAVLVLPVSGGAAAPSPTLSLGYIAVGTATLLAAFVAGWRLLRLALDGAALLRWSSGITVLQPPKQVQRLARRLARELGSPRYFDVRLAPRVATPLTFGILRPVIVLPTNLVDRERKLRMALTHELVHIRRRDYLLHALERLLAALFAIHPGVEPLVRSIAHYRELSCDAEVLARPGTNASAYARLLFELADQASPSYALSMAPRPSFLKQRIEAMNTMSSYRSSTRVSLMVSFAFLALATVMVACSDLFVEKPSTQVQEPPPPPSSEVEPLRSEEDPDVYMVVEDMPEPVGGIEAVLEQIEYPELARRAGVEGRVVVQFIVTPEGQVEDPVVVQGLGAGLDEEAIRAISATEFEPGRQDGEPVRVRMSWPVHFRLDGNGQAAEHDSPPPPPSSPRAVLETVIDSEDRVSIAGTRVSPEDVRSVLQRYGAMGVNQIRLQVDGNASMGVVSDVMKSIRGSGIEYISYSNAQETSTEEAAPLRLEATSAPELEQIRQRIQALSSQIARHQIELVDLTGNQNPDQNRSDRRDRRIDHLQRTLETLRTEQQQEINRLARLMANRS